MALSGSRGSDFGTWNLEEAADPTLATWRKPGIRPWNLEEAGDPTVELGGNRGSDPRRMPDGFVFQRAQTISTRYMESGGAHAFKSTKYRRPSVSNHAQSLPSPAQSARPVAGIMASALIAGMMDVLPANVATEQTLAVGLAMLAGQCVLWAIFRFGFTSGPWHAEPGAELGFDPIFSRLLVRPGFYPSPAANPDVARSTLSLQASLHTSWCTSHWESTRRTTAACTFSPRRPRQRWHASPTTIRPATTSPNSRSPSSCSGTSRLASL